jgi:hypothetical protein
VNYSLKVDARIFDQDSFLFSFLSRTIIFFSAFAFPYLVYSMRSPQVFQVNRSFFLLLLLAPAIFSFKVAFNFDLNFAGDWELSNYWNHVIYWPSLTLITTLLLYFTWKRFDADQPFYGVTTHKVNWKPYIMMLLFMIPLIAAASTQTDFQSMYPKLKVVTDAGSMGRFGPLQKALFELAYGCDFITIELFFRGFLVLAFCKWVGKAAILPMACFYCTIHFGKPLGECISSYFGGMILGIVVYHTRSIFGGLMVHLGIAWLMEIGGYVGNAYFNN